MDERRIRASADGVVRVSGRDGEEIVFRAGGEAPLLAVAFGAGGEKVMTVAADATLRMWNVDGSGEETVRGGLSAGIVPPGGGGAGGEDRRGVVLAASFDPSGERLLTLSAGGAAEVWTLDAYPEGAPVTLAAGDGAAVVSAGWYGDGRRLWTRSTSGTLREWRIDTGELLASFREETTICLDAAFREKNLGEAPEPARAKFASCERLHGRP